MIIRGSFGNLFGAFRGQNLRTLFRQSPEELVIALVLLALMAGVVAYVVRLYFTYFYAEQFTRYPTPIAKSLRRAIYYSNYRPDPKLALKYWRLALEQCDQHHLDPFSDDVTGIKIQLAAWLEKIGNYDGAIKVLETLLSDCKRWVELMETSVKEGKVAQNEATLLPPSNLLPDTREGKANTKPETLWGKRTRLLGKCVGISVKLGELYADEHVLKEEKAHERLTWAVETALGEFRRRTVEGLKEGEGQWMNAEAIGGALESLGHSYERKGQFHLALPLFFQALRLCQDQCHMAVLMNNLAISFAQHPLHAPYETLEGILPATEKEGESSPTPKQQTREELLESAKRWAKNAYQHAKEPTGDKRTPECDEACAVALINLGDIAVLTGSADEARRRYEKGLNLSKKLGFPEGLKQAEAGLRQLAQ
ncbi:TPR domain-containing protein [Pleurostoma richardsiae]|uniref:TPR domain-containing protein n=1 Tax=Pleurostoma richardsiae TaxID=41990 RepID=A0AA38S4Z0_9PEZI|nr:TPR domain-containing protein [Pleurostoma richardsiae]